MRVAVDGKTIRVQPGTTSGFCAVDDPARAYTNTPTAGKMTGFGDAYETCGEAQPHFCSECSKPVTNQDDELIPIGQTCWRQECPRCGSGWAMRRAFPIVSKIESLRKEEYARRGESPRFHHVVVPMQNFRTAREDADDAYFHVAKAAIEEVGVNVLGGALMHHSHTGAQRGEDDLGKWKERLFSGRDWDGDVSDELEEHHHIHALVLADSIDYLSCEALQERTNILVKRVENNDEDTKVSLFNVEDLAEATTYALSHARLADGADAYRYFGQVANHQADHRVEARCKEVVRSVVPKTLDLHPADTLCTREIGSEEIDKIPHVEREGPSGDSEDSESGESDETDDADQDNETTSESTETESEEIDVEQDQDDDCDGVDSESAEKPVEESQVDESDEQGGGYGVRCNGRLVPFEYVPSFLADDETREHDDELRERHESWEADTDRDIS